MQWTITWGKVIAEPLNFCYTNIYGKLDKLEKNIVSVLLAARQGLTTTQLQELINEHGVPFTKACQNLIRMSIVERNSKPDGTTVFQLGGLMFDFLSQNYPPADPLTKSVREIMRSWQIEQDEVVPKIRTGC